MADATPAAPVVFKKRAGRANLKKRAATPPSASDSEYSSEDESGARVKRRRKGGITTSTSAITKPTRDLGKSTQFAGDRSAAITTMDDATRTSNWVHMDEAASGGQQQDGDVEKDGTYKGAKGYGNFIQKNPDKLGKSVGPVKAPTNMRMITLVDFAPDVCKDYKQTGFCGFGDSCKFLHAREDYKQGWQLDKEWEKAGKSKAPQKGTTVASANRSGNDQADDSDNDEEAKELEKIPFACIICKEPYKSPVVTKCGHYFCEACALKRHKSKGGKQCANCGADTGGTFNVAKNLRKLLDKKRDRIRKRKEKARENGEEVSDEEE